MAGGTAAAGEKDMPVATAPLHRKLRVPLWILRQLQALTVGEA
jgi:hypothetical protein